TRTRISRSTWTAAIPRWWTTRPSSAADADDRWHACAGRRFRVQPPFSDNPWHCQPGRESAPTKSSTRSARVIWARYRARDMRLDRDVAIKILPETFAHGLARFEREAKTLAALNHPNVGSIYGVETAPAALILELVDGPTLADRIAQGPIPID